jgi:pyruvate dehydrogenase E1 component alpha subunit
MAFGSPPLAAEILGRETGICHGKGGSMHVADFGRGILGANGIVGGGIGLAVGAALAAQLDTQLHKKDGRVSVVFFGDGGSAQGIVAEALNMAAVWKLPLVMVCENNGFSEFSPTDTVTAGEIWRRAEPFGVPAAAIDGNDVLAVWDAAEGAIQRARSGGGPSFIEARTYRWRGHVESEKSFLSGKYREDEDIEQWKKRDPIERFAQVLQAQGMAGELPGMRAEAERRVAGAWDQAMQDALPAVARAFEDMFTHG